MKKFESERNIPFSVILGFIPRIHTKLNLSRHYRACPDNLDSRVKPENDKNLECIETAESGVDKVVSSCEKNPNVHKTYMNFLRQRKTALDAPLHAVSSGRLLPQCAPDATGFLSDVYKRGTQAQKFLVDGVQCGRSMIEMLGVLAIIGVLSVGGIAGYSKAMEKIHVNKIVNMISDISTTIKTAYINQKTYDEFGSDDVSVQDLGILPPEYIFEFEGEKYFGLSSPLTLICTMGTTMDVFSAFSIGVLVPQNLCMPLLTYDWRNADMKGIAISKDSGAGNSVLWAYMFVAPNEQDYPNNCNDASLNDDAYYCVETRKKRFKPVSPAIAAKYCESSAEDIFGTGQMYVGFDLLADIKVPAH